MRIIEYFLNKIFFTINRKQIFKSKLKDLEFDFKFSLERRNTLVDYLNKSKIKDACSVLNIASNPSNDKLLLEVKRLNTYLHEVNKQMYMCRKELNN